MIPAHPLPAQAVRWQLLWRDAFRDSRELLGFLGLDAESGRISEAALAAFPMRVPRGFAAKMRHGDPADPLLRQVLPLVDEERVVSGFTLDAVGDGADRAGRGLLHKYSGRALLVATGSCAVHCRYCFRRHFPYGEQAAAADGWRDALDYLAGNPDIDEVLLSGGDPLSLATSKLAELTRGLRALPQVRRLRLHTRLPIVLPERVDAELVDWLAGLPWPVAIVVHANHANELGPDVAAACARLAGAGARLLNQSVLLRGVNDDVGALADLSAGLFDIGVLPYYLHQLDRVAGTAHFEVDDDRARTLHAQLHRRLPGYLLPRLVREVPGEPGKSLL
ncbi:EF-P beta-lysylation protein EpmB [soil metagenome]